MKRFAHIAIITIETEGRLEHGEWIEGRQVELPMKGLWTWDESGKRIKKNIDGSEFIVRGEFSTRRKPTAEERKNVRRISIAELDIDLKIESWEPYQKHSVIYV